MIFLELTKSNERFDNGWNLKQACWAPTLTRNGSNWPFWSLLNRVEAGDIVVQTGRFYHFE